MSTASSSFMAEETGACVLLALPHRTIIVSVEVELLAPPSDATSSFLVWALTVPRRERSFADGVYTVTAPVPLGYVSYTAEQSQLQTHQQQGYRHNQHHHISNKQNCQSHHAAVLSLGRWELCAGTRVALALTPPNSDVNVVRHAMGEALRTKRSVPQLIEKQDSPGSIIVAARYRLCGIQVAAPDPAADAAEWQPLLHRRWYELKSYVRVGTVVPHFTSPGRGAHRRLDRDVIIGDDEGFASSAAPLPPQPMYAGDVREAKAISLNRQRILWADGSVGLYDEVKPFYRVYQPARRDKTIRVRLFPHRYADVIGEIPFGQCVEAFGRATDPFTQEQYVLLYLPADEVFAHHLTTYDLMFVEHGRYVWGWSKLAGSSGLPLLVERQGDETGLSGQSQVTPTFTSAATLLNNSATTSPVIISGIDGLLSAIRSTTTNNNTYGDHESSNRTEVMPLPEGTFYTPVREGRVVRIRKRPTLTAATLREMEANEVRAAEALVTVPIRAASSSDSNASAGVPHVFVQWQQGGYSLLRNEVECFLVPVMLSRVPRRFPIRTRSSGGGDSDSNASQEIVDLSKQRTRKRRRHGESSDDDENHTEAEIEALLHRRKKTGTTAAAASDDTLLSPYLLPASLQEGLRKGVVRLEDLPPLCQPSEEEESEESEEDVFAETDDSDSCGDW